MSAGDRGATRHPDRVGLARWASWSLLVSTAVVVGVAGSTAAQNQLSPAAGFVAGAAVAVLAVAGLPSLSIRLVARVLLLISAAGLLRFGLLRGSITSDGQLLLAWLVAAVALLVVADRIGTDANPPLDGRTPIEDRSAPAGTWRAIAGVASVVVLAVVVLLPLLLPHVGRPTEPGRGATLDPQAEGAGALRATSSLDMTTRPHLTDAVVFTVDTDRATFWRGETFDRWDGRTWTRSDDRLLPLASIDVLQMGADDLGARGPESIVQRFHMATPYSDVVYAAASPVQIDIDRPVRQRPDGTLISAPLGEGATYTVTSRRQALSPARLRAADGAVPTGVLVQYAQPPQTTARVLDAATRITAGAATTYDKVLAIEAWMGRRVTYSLDAPLAPEGVDVVDHFLFDAESGWCEQIASSLVVLARANGIPARLVTGFVPDEHDPVTGLWTVRERDAHAWAEVWFPKVGWVPFDPTADVPLGGTGRADGTVLGWLLGHLVVLLLAAGALVLLGGPARRALARRWRDRQRPGTWAATADARLVALGRRAGRDREAHETATSFAAALADRWGDERLVLVGLVIDDALYAASSPSPEAERRVDEVLAHLEAAELPGPIGAAHAS